MHVESRGLIYDATTRPDSEPHRVLHRPVRPEIGDDPLGIPGRPLEARSDRDHPRLPIA